VSRNMYAVVWYLPIYTCRIGGNGERASEGAEELVFINTDWQPFFLEAKVLRSEGIHSAQSSERAILHSHPRVGREEWQTTRSLRLAEFA